MIVFDLKCGGGHVFEAWFGSSGDYADQRARGLVACPICGDDGIEKAAMAPAIPAKSNRAPSSVALPPPPTGAVTNQPPEAAQMQAMLQALAAAQTKALENSEWVGRAFADKARAMHYGEEAHSAIHGEVAPQEARALIEEGVEVAPLPLPVVPPEAKN